MKAGQLRHRVAVQSATETTSSSGAKTKEWRTIQSLWASIEPMKGKKLVEAQQVCPRVTHEVRIRGRYPLTTLQRFLYVDRTTEIFRERILNVGYVTNLEERGITIVAFATEVPA